MCFAATCPSPEHVTDVIVIRTCVAGTVLSNWIVCLSVIPAKVHDLTTVKSASAGVAVGSAKFATETL